MSAAVIDEAPGTPRLFEYDISTDPARLLASVTFGYVPSGPSGFNGPPEIGIFGLSGSLVSLQPGDANGDGKVGFADLLILAQNYGRTDVDFYGGDFTGDGKVGFDDLLVLSQHYQQGAAAAGSAVPEPSSMAVVTAIAMVLSRRRR